MENSALSKSNIATCSTIICGNKQNSFLNFALYCGLLFVILPCTLEPLPEVSVSLTLTHCEDFLPVFIAL
jgi:hypothetical protein